MFAVRGWTVPTSGVKAQTQAPADQVAPTSTEVPSKTVSKKRKRAQPASNGEKNSGGSSLTRREVDGATPTANYQRVANETKATERQQSQESRRIAREPQRRHALIDSHGKQPKQRSGRERAITARVLEADAKSVSEVKSASQLNGTATTQSPPRGPIAHAEPKLTKLQSSMREKLISSRFRHLNEVLYTKPSIDSLSLFKESPELFGEYHEGFRRQVEAWPENPVSGFLGWIKRRGNVRTRHTASKSIKSLSQQRDMLLSDASASIEALPRDSRTGTCTIADLGCGEGQLAEHLTSERHRKPVAKQMKLVIHSFDLSSTSPHVTACDIRELPLADDSVDVAIFCLALMGTNWIEFIEEANRILRWNGECWIAEVGSRFAMSPRSTQAVEHSVGRRKLQAATSGRDKARDAANYMPVTVEEVNRPSQPTTDVSGFVDVLRRRGFQLMDEPELGNRMFVRMRFRKALPPSKGKGVLYNRPATKPTAFPREHLTTISDEAEASVLKPCVYKSR